MPRANIYIRKEDTEKWAAIQDKPQWLHNALNQQVEVITKFERGKPDEHSTDGGKTFKQSRVIKTSKDAQKALEKAKDRETASAGIFNGVLKFCKIHDTPLDSRGRCLQKGCKYA